MQSDGGRQAVFSAMTVRAGASYVVGKGKEVATQCSRFPANRSRFLRNY